MALIDTAEAVQRLKKNQVVAIPTETVYGLAGRIHSPEALRAIFTTKQRPLFDPLIVHVLDTSQIKDLAQEWPPEIAALTDAFWPGPLTVVVPKSARVNPLISSGLETVALRSPAHPKAREILTQLGEPLAAPSANLFGRTSPTKAEHVLEEFNHAVAVVDGGPCAIGIESTVVRWVSSPSPELQILRPGGVSRAELENHFQQSGFKLKVMQIQTNASPGHLEHHYQPTLPLAVVQGPPTATAKEMVAKQLGVPMDRLWELRLSTDPRLAARELYDQLRHLSSHREGAILFGQPRAWEGPEWEALRDRIQRASTVYIHLNN